MKTQKTASARTVANPTTPAKIDIRKYECCGQKVVLMQGEKKNLAICAGCARAHRENNLAAKRPLRQGIISPGQVAALQSVVRQANHERAVALNAKAVAVVAQALAAETHLSWEEVWGRHLAETADKLGSTMDNPIVRELAAETFAG